MGINGPVRLINCLISEKIGNRFELKPLSQMTRGSGLNENHLCMSGKNALTPSAVGVMPIRDVRFGLKVGKIRLQMGQIWDFFRSYFSTFWLADPRFTETDL